MIQLPRILVVDDEPSNLMLLVNILEQDYELQIAKTGHETLNQLKQDPLPDLLLLDIQLPDISGLEIIKLLKQSDRTRDIPVIFITSLTDTQDEQTGLELGGSDYITKPIKPDIISARVRTQLDQVRLRREALEQSRMLEEDLLLSQQVGQIGSWKLDPINQMLVGTPEFHRLLGTEPDSVLNREQFIQLVHPDHREVMNQAWSDVISGDSYNIEFQTNTSDENWLYVVSRIEESINKKTIARGILQNITHKKQYEQTLETLAYCDPLTRMPNQYSSEQWLTQHLDSQQNISCMLYYIDLDDLSSINNNMGIGVGDQVIKTVADRLKQYDSKTTMVSHHGGDQFMICICPWDTHADPKQFVVEIQNVISEPIHVEQDSIVVTACVGSILYSESEYNSSLLTRMAGYAGYLAKLKGKNSYAEYNMDEYRKDLEIQDQINQIRTAFHNQEFILYYQPKINLITREIMGFEALIRWDRPGQGIVGPGAFIPIIESHPLIVEFGDFVIKTALEQLEWWESQGLSTSVSVNVATIQYEHPNFISKLSNNLTRHGGQLDMELEILETGPMSSLTYAIKTINQAKSLKLSISLDDFGVGHSSLQTLQAFKPNFIKIDKSFILKINECQDSYNIVDAILMLGETFDIRVIAEGVETNQHWKCLTSMGCVYGQGFGIARPMPADQVMDWCRAWKRDQALTK